MHCKLHTTAPAYLSGSARWRLASRATAALVGAPPHRPCLLPLPCWTCGVQSFKQVCRMRADVCWAAGVVVSYKPTQQPTPGTRSRSPADTQRYANAPRLAGCRQCGLVPRPKLRHRRLKLLAAARVQVRQAVGRQGVAAIGRGKWEVSGEHWRRVCVLRQACNQSKCGTTFIPQPNRAGSGVT